MLLRQILKPGTMSASDRTRLSERLYRVHSQIFDGVTKAEFASYVVNSKAKDTSILLFKNHRSQIVGYHALHFFEKSLRSRPCMIVRAESALLRAYRGQGSTFSFSLRKFLECKLRNPRHDVYYLGCMVHPAAYLVSVRHAAEIWPAPRQTVPPEIVSLMEELADEFHLERADPQNPLVRKVGWKVRQTEKERAYWRSCNESNMRFFVDCNPDFAEGNGLLILAPISVKNLRTAAGRILASHLKTLSRR